MTMAGARTMAFYIFYSASFQNVNESFLLKMIKYANFEWDLEWFLTEINPWLGIYPRGSRGGWRSSRRWRASASRRSRGGLTIDERFFPQIFSWKTAICSFVHCGMIDATAANANVLKGGRAARVENVMDFSRDVETPILMYLTYSKAFILNTSI